METIDEDNRRLFVPQERSPSSSTVPRSSTSASPKKRARLLSPERSNVWDIPDNFPSMGDEVNDPSIDKEDKGGHGAKPVCLVYSYLTDTNHDYFLEPDSAGFATRVYLRA
jgi:hypothetical protein